MLHPMRFSVKRLALEAPNKDTAMMERFTCQGTVGTPRTQGTFSQEEEIAGAFSDMIPNSEILQII